MSSCSRSQAVSTPVMPSATRRSASYSNCRSSASRYGRSWPRAACLGVRPSNAGTFSSSQNFSQPSAAVAAPPRDVR